MPRHGISKFCFAKASLVWSVTERPLFTPACSEAADSATAVFLLSELAEVSLAHVKEYFLV